jgi:hypothetical protein
MGDRRLDEWREAVIAAESTEVTEQAVDLLRRWRDIVGAARVVVVPADPILFSANPPSDV